MSFRKSKLNTLKNNLAFTMVELVIVLALIAILASITIFSALAWLDWSKFQAENSNAEDIFFAAQNQLTELDSSGAMNRRVITPLQESSNYSSFILAQGMSENASGLTIKDDFVSIKIDEDGNGYDWKTLWNNDPNLTKKSRTIYRLIANPGDYDAYVNGTLSTDGSKDGAKLLFELIDSYIADKSVLNGAISLEFSPEAAQVFAVCYSDRGKAFSYGTGSDTIDITKRCLTDRKDALLGYYGVDTLTSKLKGKNKAETTHKLEIYNGNALCLILSKEDINDSTIKNLSSKDQITYKIFGSETYAGTYEDEILEFTITLGTGNNQLNPEAKKTVKDANSCVLDVEMTIGSGIYAGQPKTFRVPAWIDEDGSVYIILDAVDVQAQSLTYAISQGVVTGDGIDQAKETARFDNTFSFYRFGFTNVNYIRASATITYFDGTPAESLNARPYKGLEEYNASGIAGERTTFANYKADYVNIAQSGTTNVTDPTAIYGISNARHLYNVRFETDYKHNNLSNDDYSSRLFLLENDIDWNDLISGTFTEGNTDYDGVNLFLNSYVDSTETTGKTESGIEFDGKIEEFKYIDGNTLKYAGTDTSKYPFPGFRMLGFGDSFTQLAKLDVDHPETTHFSISNLNISFTANCVYGVYGKDIQNQFLAKQSAAKNHYSIDSIDYSDIITKSKRGSMPLGLFAENYGNVSNIELKNINVYGVEGFPREIKGTSTPSKFAFTSKVGGFVGDNCGTISNLFIDANNEDGTSFITGREDVGGIVGHQYYKARSINVPSSMDTKTVTLSGCINEADVTGIEYVGGIIGRIYPGSAKNDTTTTAGKSVFDISYNVGNKKNYYSDTHLCLVDSSKVILDEGLHIFEVINCKNHGEIGMEYNYANYTIDNNIWHRGYFYGGIAGAALLSTNIDINNQNANKNIGNSYEYYNTTFRKAIISNCESYTLYSDSEVEDILTKTPGVANPKHDDYLNRRLQAIFVGGIVGGTRFAYIENCSTTPDSSDKGSSYIFGDRYVGGIAGYSVETCYTFPSDRQNYTSNELDKLSAYYNDSTYKSKILAIRDNYSVINGTNVVGNYAVGGIAGSFGRPDSGIQGKEFYGNIVENSLSGSNNNGSKIPYGCGQMMYNKNYPNSLYSFSGGLNTAIVLCNNYNRLITESASQEGKSYYGLGGITGLSTLDMSDCDYIQTESTKLAALKWYGFDTDNKTSSSILNSVTVSSLKNDILDKLDSSAFLTDAVGGIVGQFYGDGSLNYSTSKTDGSYVDAIVIGRNRVGGFVGDTISDTDGRTPSSLINNTYPWKYNSSSSGMYVLGKDNVGGVVGAYSDGGNGNLQGETCKGGLNPSGRFNNDKPIVNGYHVYGERAVGGLVGIFAEGKNQGSYEINFLVNPSNSEDRVIILGNMYVGGIVGMQEKSTTFNQSTGYRYYANINNFDISAGAFAGGVAGGVYSKGAFFKLDRLISKTSTIRNTNITADVFAGGFTGLYAYNTSDKVLTYNDSVYNTKNNNYKPANVTTNGVASYVSVNGLYNNANVYNLYYDPNDTETTLSQKIDAIKSVYSDSPSASVEYNLSDLTNVLDSTDVVSAGVYSGGLLGYVPENTQLTITGYDNKAKVFATNSITGADGYEYSYLGGIIGKVSSSMTLNNCSNSNGVINAENVNIINENSYYSNKGTFMGGLTEVNDGTIIGGIVNGVYKCVNNSCYEYTDKNIAAFAGLNNGTIENVKNAMSISGKESAGIAVYNNTNGTIKKCVNSGIIYGTYAGGIASTNNGTIVECTNDAEIISGNYLGGIAAQSTATSSITDSYNFGNVGNTSTTSAGGILGTATGGSATISNCVNVGLIRAGSDNSTAAGIAYDTNDGGIINKCRNYGTGFANGITATTAGSIKYCLDTSNAANHFGDVATAEPTDTMFANFYIARRIQGTSLEDPGASTPPSSKGYFMAFQSYATTTYASGAPREISFDFEHKNDISNMVLGIKPELYDDSDYHNESSKWLKVDPENQNRTLSFILMPISDDGSTIAYANMKDFAIVWDNFDSTDYHNFFKYAEQDGYQSYRDDFESIKLVYPVNKSISFLDIAKDERTNGTHSVQYSGNQTTLNALSNWWTQTDENLSLYATAMYCLAKEQATDENKTVTLDAYLSLLYTYAKNGSPINFYNPNDSYNTYITKYSDNSYSEYRTEFESKTYDYTELFTTTFKAIADEEFNVNTDHATDYGLSDDYLNKQNDNKSDYYLRYAQSVYGYFIDNRSDSLNIEVTTEGEKVINGTKDSIDAILEEYRSLLYSTYATKYVRVNYNNFPQLQVDYDIIFTSVDTAGVRHSARPQTVYGTNTTNPYYISTFDYSNYQLQSYKDDMAFDPERVVEIRIAVKKDNYTTASPYVGIRAFLWTYNDEEGTTVIHNVPDEYTATVDEDDTLFAGLESAADVLAKIKTLKLKSQKLVVHDESKTEFDLDLWNYTTDIKKLKYNPLLSGTGNYLSDESVMDFTDPTKCIRMQMYRDVDAKYLSFIGSD